MTSWHWLSEVRAVLHSLLCFKRVDLVRPHDGAGGEYGQEKGNAMRGRKRKKQLDSWLVLWAQSTTKDYIRAGHKLHSLSKLFISQVIIPQIMFLEPIYIPRALNTGTCLRQGDLFYSAGLHRNHVLATANTGEIGRGFGKNAGEWTGR